MVNMPFVFHLLKWITAGSLLSTHSGCVDHFRQSSTVAPGPLGLALALRLPVSRAAQMVTMVHGMVTFMRLSRSQHGKGNSTISGLIYCQFHIFSHSKLHKNWGFTIATLQYQRVFLPKGWAAGRFPTGWSIICTSWQSPFFYIVMNCHC